MSENLTPPPNTPIITGLSMEFFSRHGGLMYYDHEYEPLRNWNFPTVKTRAGYIDFLDRDVGSFEFDLTTRDGAGGARLSGYPTITYNNLDEFQESDAYKACSTHNETLHDVINYVRKYLSTANNGKQLFKAGDPPISVEADTAEKQTYAVKWESVTTTESGNDIITWRVKKGSAEFKTPKAAEYANFFKLTKHSNHTATVEAKHVDQDDENDDLRIMLRHIADTILYPSLYRGSDVGVYEVESHTYNNQPQYEKTDWGKFYDNDGNVLKFWAELVLAVKDIQLKVHNSGSRKVDVTLKKYHLRSLWSNNARPIPGDELHFSANITIPESVELKYNNSGQVTGLRGGPLSTTLKGTTSEVTMVTLYGITAYEPTTFCCNEGDFLEPHTFLSSGSFEYNLRVVVYGQDKPSMCLPEYIEVNVGEEIHKSLHIQCTRCMVPEIEYFEYKLLDGSRSWGTYGTGLKGPNGSDSGLNVRLIFRESVLGGGQRYCAGVMLEGIAKTPGVYWYKVGLKTDCQNLAGQGYGAYHRHEFPGGENEEYIVVYIRPTDYRPGDLVACIPSTVYQAPKHYLAVSHANLVNTGTGVYGEAFTEHAEDDTPEGEWHYVNAVWDNKYPTAALPDTSEQEGQAWLNELQTEIGLTPSSSANSNYTTQTPAEYAGDTAGHTHTVGYWYKAHNEILTIYDNGKAYRSDHFYIYVITRDTDRKWRLYCASTTEWHLTSWRILATVSDVHGGALSDVQPPMYWKKSGTRNGLLCLRGSESFVIASISNDKGLTFNVPNAADYGGVFSYAGTYKGTDGDREVFQRQPVFIRAQDYKHYDDGKGKGFSYDATSGIQTDFNNDTLLYTAMLYLYQKDIAAVGQPPNVVWVIAPNLACIAAVGIAGKECVVKVTKADYTALVYNPARPEKFLGGESTSNTGDIGFLLETTATDAPESVAYAPMSISNWSAEGWSGKRYPAPLGLFAKQTVNTGTDTNNAFVETGSPDAFSFSQQVGGIIWQYYPMLRGHNLSNLRAKCKLNGIDQAYGSWATAKYGTEAGYSIQVERKGSPGGTGDYKYGLPGDATVQPQRRLAASRNVISTYSETVTRRVWADDVHMMLEQAANPSAINIWSNGYIIEGQYEGDITISDSEAEEQFYIISGTTVYDTDGAVDTSASALMTRRFSNPTCHYKVSFFGMMAHAQVPAVDASDTDPVRTKRPATFNALHIRASMKWTGDIDGTPFEEEYSAEWDTNVASDVDGTAEIVASSSDEQRQFKHQEILNYQPDGGGGDYTEAEELLSDGTCSLHSTSAQITGRSNRAEVEAVEDGLLSEALLKYPIIDDEVKTAEYNSTDGNIRSTYIYKGTDADEAYTEFRNDLDSEDYDFSELDFPGYDVNGSARTVSGTKGGAHYDCTAIKTLTAMLTIGYNLTDE